MEICLMRADERLVHGKIINEWCLFLQPTCLLIIDQDLPNNQFMANVYCSLAPVWLKTKIMNAKDAAAYLKGSVPSDERVFVLGRSPIVFSLLKQEGISFEGLTLADKMYLSNKAKVPSPYKKAIEHLKATGVKLSVLDAPDDKPIYI